MKRLIPPDMHRHLSGMRLTARVRASGPVIGSHAGRHPGPGLEFAQYRAYEPGDELRRVDWKLYSRSDRFYVREAIRDTSLIVWLVLDASASMAQADAARPGYTKLEAAKVIAACIGDIALRHGDSCGLATIGGAGIAWLPPAAGMRHRDRLELELQRTECRGGWPGDCGRAPEWQRVSRDSLVMIVSDGFDPGLPTLAERLAARGQVLSCGLVSCEERDFPFAGGWTFREPETGEERRVDAPAERADFLARFAQGRAALQRRLARGGVRHIDHVLDEPLETALRRLLYA